jgi:hypothetical protein
MQQLEARVEAAEEAVERVTRGQEKLKKEVYGAIERISNNRSDLADSMDRLRQTEARLQKMTSSSAQSSLRFLWMALEWFALGMTTVLQVALNVLPALAAVAGSLWSGSSSDKQCSDGGVFFLVFGCFFLVFFMLFFGF